MKDFFFNIAFVIFILTIYCKVSNGNLSVIHNDIRNLYLKFKNVDKKIDEAKKQLSEQHDKSIKEVDEKIEKLNNEILSLKLENEELKLRTAPKSCTELANQKINRSQDIFIDVDGIDYGFQPTKAHCSFPSNKTTFGRVQEIVFNPSEETHNLTYDEAMFNQIKMTIDNSAFCSQTWSFACYSSSLSGNSVSLFLKIIDQLYYAFSSAKLY